MKVPKTRFIISVLCFLLLSLQTQSAEIMVGDQTISIPSPSGFSEISSISPETVQLFDDMCPPTNRLLAVFVSEDDAGLLIQGKAGQFNSYMLVQSSKEMEAFSITKYLFKEVRIAMRSQFESLFEKKRELIEKITDQTGRAISKRIDEEVDFNVGDVIPLGIDSETASSITASQLVKYKLTATEKTFEQIVAQTMCILVVKGKIIYLYVYKTYDDKSALDWTRKTSHSWTNEVLKTNSISSALSLGRIVPEGTVIDPVVKELLTGQWEKYSINSHPKSEGLDISIKYPQSWRREEGERPHIVQKFSGVTFNGIMPSCMLIVQKIPTWAGIFLQGEFEEDMLKEMLPPNAQLIDGSSTKIDGEPCAWVKYYHEAGRAGINFSSYCLQYVLFCKGKMFIVGCSVDGVAEDKELLEDAFNSYLPVFQMMAGNIVIQDKWSGIGTTTSTMDSIMEDIWGEYWLLTLIISAILTWGIGLAPPLIIRFVIARRPLSKWLSIILVIIFLFFNLILFTALGSQSKTHAALFLVAWASFAILRKGSRRWKAKEQEVISAPPPLPELKPTKIPELKPTAPTYEKICDENIQDRPEDILASPKNIEESSHQEQDAVTQVDNHEDTKVSLHEVESNNDLGSRPIVLGRIEKCANCDRIIGRLEQSYNFKGSIVCVKCYQVLNP